MPLTDQQKNAIIYNALKKFSPEEEQLINFYELEWHIRHRVPTVEEVANNLKCKQTVVNYHLTKPKITKALSQRGIPWQNHSQNELTGAQQAAALTVMNIADERTIPEKLDQLGINPSQYYAWLNDPKFKNFVDVLADQNLRNIRPAAVTELAKKIHSGDWQATKFWLETTGELQNSDAPQSEQLIKMFVEVIQRHVKDPQIIIAIAQDIKNLSQNRRLEAIEGSVVTDEEIEDARKKLNI